MRTSDRPLRDHDLFSAQRDTAVGRVHRESRASAQTLSQLRVVDPGLQHGERAGVVGRQRNRWRKRLAGGRKQQSSGERNPFHGRCTAIRTLA